MDPDLWDVLEYCFNREDDFPDFFFIALLVKFYGIFEILEGMPCVICEWSCFCANELCHVGTCVELETYLVNQGSDIGACLA